MDFGFFFGVGFIGVVDGLRMRYERREVLRKILSFLVLVRKRWSCGCYWLRWGRVWEW